MADGDQDEEEEAEAEVVNINDLPRELLFDIFSRCPPKTLHLLRCVCSKWLSILTVDPDFIPLYHHHHRLNPLLLLLFSTSSGLLASFNHLHTGLLRFKFALSSPSSSLNSVLSSHGTACFIFDSKLLLFDPATARTSNFSTSPNFKSTCSAAIGFSATAAEFKIVNLYTYEKFDNHHYSKVKELVCEILTVPNRKLGFDDDSPEWRFLGKCPFNVLGRKSYVCVDGSLYWLVAEKSYNPDCVRILRLDLVSEEFGVVCFPRNYSDRSAECLGLLEVEERLCLTDRLPWEVTMVIWELEDFVENVWVRKYEIDLSRFDRYDMKILGHIPGISEGRGELVIKVGMKECLVYDLDNGTFREIPTELEEDGEEEMDLDMELKLLLDRKHLL